MILNEDENTIIEEHKGFIYSTASNVCQKKLSWENDDELSIAMIAFNKAHENYKSSKGNFLSYARVIIKNSLIDFFRTNKNNDYLTFEDSDTENSPNYIENKISLDVHEKEIENNLRMEEIKFLSEELLNYNLTFSDLVDSSPTHKNTRDELLNISFLCFENEEILEYIKTKRRFPVNQVILISNKNRKYIEKWRRYLLVLIIILSNDNYPYIKSYLNIKR